MLQRNVFQFHFVFHWSPALYFSGQNFQVVLFLLYCVSSSCTLTSKQWTWWETDSSAGSVNQEKWDQTKLRNAENTFCSKEGRPSPANATVVCTGINHGAEVFPLPKLYHILSCYKHKHKCILSGMYAIDKVKSSTKLLSGWKKTFGFLNYVTLHTLKVSRLLVSTLFTHFITQNKICVNSSQYKSHRGWRSRRFEREH